MNHQDSRNVTTKTFSPTALALLLGLALAFPGSAALATNDPIPGVDIIVKKNPGGIVVSVPTGADGTYQFKVPAAGNYDLSVGGKRVQTISVDANQGISGVLTRNDDGTASITFNGRAGVVPDLPSAPVNTSRSDKKAGIAKGEKSPLPTTKETTTAVKAQITALQTSSTAPGPDGGGVKPGIMPAYSNFDRDPGPVDIAATTDEHGAFHSTKLSTGKYKLTPTYLPDEPFRSARSGAPKGSDAKLPGILRIINNSETESANVEGSTPVNGVGGLGGGRFTFKPTSPVADSANVDSSNRDHIDQDAQTDIRKKTAVHPGVPGDARRVTDSGPDSGNVELPGKKHHYKGVVTLVKGTAPNPGGEVDVPEARTFEVTVQPVNDAPSKVGDPIPEPVGPPVKVQLRNVDTGALAGTTVVATGANFPDKDGLAVTTLRKGEFTFSLPVGNYVVEIVDATGKIIGTSASIAVSSGGTVIRSSDGKMMIFDRWGNLIATPITVEDEKFKANNKVTNDREKRSIAAPNNGGDTTPQNKYDDDFRELNTKRVEKPVAVKAQITALQTSDSSTAPGTDDRDGKLPGKKAAPKPTSPGTGPHRSLTVDQPIAGLNVKLEKNPGGSIEVNATVNSSGVILAAETMFSSTTDSQGNFHFEQLPAGNYKLILPDQPSQSLTVSGDGIARGTVVRDPNGSVSIFDRFGKPFTAPPPKAGAAKQDTPDQTSKAAKSPVDFGSGNHTMGAGPGTGPGMSHPGAGLGASPGMVHPGPPLGGAAGLGPMSPMGAGPMGGGPGGAMRP